MTRPCPAALRPARTNPPDSAGDRRHRTRQPCRAHRHAPTAYRDILAVFTRTAGALRAKDLCETLEAGTEPRHVEAMRAKLKRLGGRDVFTEPSPDCSPSIQTSPNKTPT
ncbi:hypothetical protein GCM10010182_19060 [Actinomadura cremea]|nr:hypothetical protein GCM10010182_19060 [Actinomadura cremea]